MLMWHLLILFQVTRPSSRSAHCASPEHRQPHVAPGTQVVWSSRIHRSTGCVWSPCLTCGRTV